MIHALCFGCDFACTTFMHVWYYTPMARLFAIALHLWGRIWRYSVDCCCGPCCDQGAKMCGKSAV